MQALSGERQYLPKVFRHPDHCVTAARPEEEQLTLWQFWSGISKSNHTQKLFCLPFCQFLLQEMSSGESYPSLSPTRDIISVPTGENSAAKNYTSQLRPNEKSNKKVCEQPWLTTCWSSTKTAALHPSGTGYFADLEQLRLHGRADVLQFKIFLLWFCVLNPSSISNPTQGRNLSTCLRGSQAVHALQESSLALKVWGLGWQLFPAAHIPHNADSKRSWQQLFIWIEQERGKKPKGWSGP